MINVIVFVMALSAWVCLLVSSFRYERAIKDLRAKQRLQGKKNLVILEMMKCLREESERMNDKVDVFAELTSQLLEQTQPIHPDSPSE